MTQAADYSREVPLRATKRSVSQDAEAALKNDPIRALIELITNSDDAYQDRSGKITIKVERGSPTWKFSVLDRARGMTEQEMEEKLLAMGGRTSGFEKGHNVRGNLGRGAKDVAIFGTAIYESIRDDRFVRCQIISDRINVAQLEPSRPVTKEDRARLGIPKGSGMVVDVTVTNGARCPQFATLKRDIVSNFQLRDILCSPAREVILVDSKQGRNPERLSYKAPSSAPILETEIEVSGYPLGKATFQIARLTERDEEDPRPTNRASGLLIKGRKAVYENTFFSAEGRANAKYFVGFLACPYIDTLARQRDDAPAPDQKNPIGIIRRDREGLQHSHPYYKALGEAVDPILKDLIDKEDAAQHKQSAKISDRLRKDLSDLGRALGEMFADDIEDTDEESPKDGGGKEDELIQVIPGAVVAYMGEIKTVAVR